MSMMQGFGDIKILTGNAHPRFAEKIAYRLGTHLVQCEVGKFANKETKCVMEQ
jgi:phosphoribosylpyrophosphate synthetase